jgi:hypothetical protein
MEACGWPADVPRGGRGAKGQGECGVEWDRVALDGVKGISSGWERKSGMAVPGSQSVSQSVTAAVY